MTPLLLYSGGPIPLDAGLVMLAAVLASPLLLFLFMLHSGKRPAPPPDPRAANLRTAATLVLLVALFLALFSQGTRLNWGWGSSWVLFLEAAAYFAVAMGILFVARRRSARAA